jgi:hypothetical protein
VPALTRSKRAAALFRKGRRKALNLEQVVQGFFDRVKAMAGE